jgi:hypothetical protein
MNAWMSCMYMKRVAHRLQFAKGDTGGNWNQPLQSARDQNKNVVSWRNVPFSFVMIKYSGWACERCFYHVHYIFSHHQKFATLSCRFVRCFG